MSDLGGLLLTGGASRRLGVDKARLLLDGETLAARGYRQLQAVCRTVAEVGPGYSTAPTTREDPPGSGPLAALVAGADALRTSGSTGDVLLLACDLPGVALVLAALAEARPGATTIPVDERGRRQYVCARYSTAALDTARQLVRDGARALHELLAVLDPDALDELTGFPAGTFADIDEPADARRAGIELPR